MDVKHPDIQYHRLVPVDNEAWEWARGITWYSGDMTGTAQFFNPEAQNMPMADYPTEQHGVKVEMTAIGYRYEESELQYAMRMGIPLTSKKASAAMRANEELLDDFALRGNSDLDWDGIINQATTVVPTTVLAATWAAGTAQSIFQSVNKAITDVWVASKQVFMPDTLLLPPALIGRLADIQYRDMNLLQYLMTQTILSTRGNNGERKELMIEHCRGLETVGNGSKSRAVIYKRDPRCLRFHMPMPHRFGSPMQTGHYVYEVPGICRTGGVELLVPQTSMHYIDTGD